MTYALIPILSLLHTLRGMGFKNPLVSAATSKYVTSMASGWAVFLLLQNWIAGVIVFFGILLYVVPSWGTQLIALDGTSTGYERRHEEEPAYLEWITKIADALYVAESPSQKRVYGALWASLRALFLLPLWLALAVCSQSITPLLGLAFIPFVGAIYWLCGFIPPRINVLNNQLSNVIASLAVGGVVGWLVMWGIT